jgi:hypothetical protein
VASATLGPRLSPSTRRGAPEVANLRLPQARRREPHLMASHLIEQVRLVCKDSDKNLAALLNGSCEVNHRG